MTVLKGWELEIDRTKLDLVCVVCRTTAERYDIELSGGDPITLERVLADAQAHDAKKHSTEGAA